MARFAKGDDLKKLELAKARGRRSSLEQRLEQFKMKQALETVRANDGGAGPERPSIATIMTPFDDLDAVDETALNAAAQEAIQAQKKRTEQRLQVRRQSIESMSGGAQ